MPQPNMKKEYRAELKSLGKHLGRLHREITAAERSRDRERTAMERAWKAVMRRNALAVARITKRILILRGRLS